MAWPVAGLRGRVEEEDESGAPLGVTRVEAFEEVAMAAELAVVEEEDVLVLVLLLLLKVAALNIGEYICKMNQQINFRNIGLGGGWRGKNEKGI